MPDPMPTEAAPEQADRAQRALDPIASAASTAPCFSTSVHFTELSFRALADELLFGRLVNGGRITVDLNEKDEVTLEFPEGDALPPPAPAETVEIE